MERTGPLVGGESARRSPTREARRGACCVGALLSLSSAVDDRYREQRQFGFVCRLEDPEVFFYLCCGNPEGVRVALRVALLKPTNELINRHIEIVQLDIYAEFPRFTPLLVSLASQPQAFFKDNALTMPD